MGRAPCCEKMGLKRGPWTSEEDRILINHINTFGHSNWRALPKQAGLLRCGKSCRLRWINYLKPDIKRGNITKEEEDAIINLHEMLGNRWSAIAARLPGRTDNEIKNVWHTHLKKRLPQNQQAHNTPKRNKTQTKLDTLDTSKSNQEVVKQEQNDDDNTPQSPPQCSSDISSLSSSTTKHGMSNNNNNNNNNDNDNDGDDIDLSENNLALDEDFWSEVLSSDNSNETNGVLDIDTIDYQFEIPYSPPGNHEEGAFSVNSTNLCNGMDFWHEVYARAEEITELLEL